MNFQEEWERALADFARKYEKGQVGSKNKEELIRHLTIKRDRKLETLQQQRKERERLQTAELVDRQAREMLELFKQARVVRVDIENWQSFPKKEFFLMPEKMKFSGIRWQGFSDNFAPKMNSWRQKQRILWKIGNVRGQESSFNF